MREWFAAPSQKQRLESDDETFPNIVTFFARSRRAFLLKGSCEVMKTKPTYVAHLFALAFLLGGCAANVPTVAEQYVSPSSALPSTIARPSYAFSCDPVDFHNHTIVAVAPGVKQAVPPNFNVKANVSYYLVAGFCGVHNSILGPHELYLRNEHSAKQTVVHPFITILSNGWWTGKPDIAVWEEAWYDNWLRVPADDVHLTLVHVAVRQAR
jgi:hypothetical protein